MENTTDWRTESRTVYSNDFKLRIVELASHPGANVAKIARENGVAHNLIFKRLCRAPFGKLKILYYKGFPGMSTPVFMVSVSTTVKNKGKRLRYYKRP